MKFQFHSAVIFLLCTFALGTPVWAQKEQRLTDKDAEEIKNKAKNAISELENLMNFVSFNEATSTEIQNVIGRSYGSSAGSQLFFNKKTIIEDDISPGFDKDNTKDLEVDKYLNILDVFYTKTTEPSISLANVQVSNVKKKDFLYVKVFYESNFGGKYKKTGAGYTPKQRVAVVRADKVSYRWEVRIVAITFYDPFKPITSTENDIRVVDTNPLDDPNQQQISYRKKDFNVGSSTQRKWNAGLKAGFNGSAWVATTADNARTSYKDIELLGRSGGVYGLYIRYYGGYRNLGLGTDLLYIVKGGTLKINSSATESRSFDFRLAYFQVPVFINFYFVGRDKFKPYLNLGYAPAFLLNATISELPDKTDSEGVKDWFASQHGSFVLGLGADFKVSPRNRMTLDARFDLGLNNILGDEPNLLRDDIVDEPKTISQGSLSLSLGYAFGL